MGHQDHVINVLAEGYPAFTNTLRLPFYSKPLWCWSVQFPVKAFGGVKGEAETTETAKQPLETLTMFSECAIHVLNKMGHK
eukprot:6483670-Amphidinium_carterae.2